MANATTRTSGMSARKRPSPVTDHRPLRKETLDHPTIASLTEAWLADERRARSIDSYRSFARVHVLPWAAAEHPSAIDERELEAWVRARRKDGYDKATIANLTAFWISLLRFGGVQLDTARLGLERGKRTSTRAGDVLVLREVATLVRSRLGHLFDRVMVAGLLLTGMRIGELIGARWGQVDRRAAGAWRLEYSEAWRTKAKAYGPTKDNSEHVVPIHPELQQLLEEVLDTYFDGPPAADDPVWPFFPTQNGGFLGRNGKGPRLVLADRRRWNARTALKHWYGALRGHGLALRTEHVARHTFASLLIDAGAPPIAVHAITHPGSLPPAVMETNGSGSSFFRYVHPSWEVRVAAVRSLHLPPVEVMREPQLDLELESA